MTQINQDWLTEHRRRLDAGHSVYRGDSFDSRLFSLLRLPIFPEILSGIREQRFTLGRSDVSSRVVNHWESESIVSDPREAGQGWRRYSLMDLVWLGAVLELRRFGVPSETLRNAHASLRGLGKSVVQPGSLHPFEFYVIEATQRVPVFLLVFADGDVELATEHQLETAGLMAPLADHVRIGLNAIVQRLLPKLDLSPKYSPGVDVSYAELKVLLAVRHPDTVAVTVRLKDGKPAMLETERDTEGKTVEELLAEAPHADLTVKRQDGKTVHLAQILKEKL
ncbi:hypothetical protein BH23ACT11_BH23ACT11_17700 [soil metagenome]